MPNRACVLIAVGLCFVESGIAAETSARPNVLVLYVDDMGWGQLGCYGGKLAPTLHVDALAAGGVRFTDGYVAACVCSPSRVGLVTGRYQQRTGHDANTTRDGTELELKEVTIAQRFKTAGYVTGIVGKWHLGDRPEFLPASRGFDLSFGSVSNLGKDRGPDYFRGLEINKGPEASPITTPAYTAEALKFIEAHRANPFFLYLAFNAVHAPHVATEAALQKFAQPPNRDRQYAAMIAELDESVGALMAKLRELKLEENTLVFLISDNGGAAAQAEMAGLRGRKWTLWEGGIRVPFIVAWKGRVSAGRVSAEPVIQLDVMPTALAAAGVEIKPEWRLDGVNLLPLLEGKTESLARPALYWRFGVQYAVRQGDWKLVKASKEMEPMLVNLAEDRGEQKDLSTSHPDKRKALAALWDRWNAQMPPPRWNDDRWNGGEEREQKKAKKKATQ